MENRTPFPATRADALARLKRFVPLAGRDYARLRNYDLPSDGHPHVSRLSPYLRHRVLTEAEVVEAVLGRHSQAAVEKFIQEVFWRSYWKGWLELRPSVWADYRRGLDRALAEVARDAELARNVARAEAGETDIAAFNAWMSELIETGYLHNHARMWMASIWIFTLGLPWQIGADLFLRHLLDGDPASNTLSWRWVAGLQTQGKHYIARSSNIAKYTDGRHNPEWRLNTQALPLQGPAHPPAAPPPAGGTIMPGAQSGVLLTEDDLSPGFIAAMIPDQAVSHAALICVDGRSPRAVSPAVHAFTDAAVHDAMTRWGQRFGEPGPASRSVDDIATWARHHRLDQVITPYAPVGPGATALRKLDAALAGDGITLVRVVRDWDTNAWPHATHGFFRFKSQIPELIRKSSVDSCG
jgi:deoxyribodipyrimidine photo-lyase